MTKELSIKDQMKNNPAITATLAFIISFALLKLFTTPDTEYIVWPSVKRVVLLLFLMITWVAIRTTNPLKEKATDSVRFVFKACRPVLRLVVVLGCISTAAIALTIALGQSPCTANVPLAIASTAVFCLTVGFFEEFLFRIVLGDGIIKRFKNCKNIFPITMVITSIVFGLAHVIFDINMATLTNPITLLQIIFKVTECGLFSVVLIQLYWKSHNWVAVSLVHALNDFVLLVPTAIMYGNPINGLTYVNSTATTGQVAGQFVTLAITATAVIINLHTMKSTVTDQIDYDAIRANL